MIPRNRWSKMSLIVGGTIIWGLVLIGCVSVNRTVLVAPHVPGAEFVGDKDCAECHSDQTDHFKNASHARIALADPKLGTTSCEACHGPGSLHSKAGGGKNNIVNPKKSPESCFACHTDKRGEFSLPSAHPVLAGKVSCVDCHDVHGEDSVKSSMAGINDSCTECHTAQKGPFVFEHGATKEGCVSCHNPHGSVNQKMLVARDANLCISCHLMSPVPGAGNVGRLNIGVLGTNVGGHPHGDAQRGTCWSSGCHEAPHGSNASKSFRY